MSAISSKTITQTVTLGSVNSYPIYASPLTIASTGAVEVIGGFAVYGSGTAGLTVENQGILVGASGVAIYGAAGAVTNSGTIIGTSGVGIDLRAGGSVVNSATSGQIEGSDHGVYIGFSSGTVQNSGTIRATGGSSLGVQLEASGSVDNAAGGLIQGGDGVDIRYGSVGPAIVTNVGTIIGSGTAAGYGVKLEARGTVGNNAGLIEGRTGVEILGTAGAVTNSGTIVGTGTSGTGIDLGAGGSIHNNTGGLIQGH